ncbi:MAG: hypothetical protein VW709_08310, partial [Rickettsiales bacterium]
GSFPSRERHTSRQYSVDAHEHHLTVSRIQFDSGDTIGGTAPLIMLRQIKPGRRRLRRLRRHRCRLIWVGGMALAFGAAAARYFL